LGTVRFTLRGDRLRYKRYDAHLRKRPHIKKKHGSAHVHQHGLQGIELTLTLSVSLSVSSSMYRVYSSLSVILQRDSQDKSPAGQYLQLKTGGNLIYTVRNWAGGKLPELRSASFCYLRSSITYWLFRQKHIFFHQTPGLEVRIPSRFHQPGRMSTETPFSPPRSIRQWNNLPTL
jgi:hypothetical protein